MFKGFLARHHLCHSLACGAVGRACCLNHPARRSNDGRWDEGGKGAPSGSDVAGAESRKPKVGKQHMTSHRNIFLHSPSWSSSRPLRRPRRLLTRCSAAMAARARETRRFSAPHWWVEPAGLGVVVRRGGSSGSSGGSIGSTGSSSSATVGGGTSAGVSEATSTGASEGGLTVSGGSRSAAGQVSHSQAGSGKTSGGTARAYPLSSRDNDSQSTSGGWGSLGVSAADLGYVLLALGALGVTGVVTSRLVQAPSGPEGL